MDVIPQIMAVIKSDLVRDMKKKHKDYPIPDEVFEAAVTEVMEADYDPKDIENCYKYKGTILLDAEYDEEKFLTLSRKYPYLYGPDAKHKENKKY
eukprot:SAG22_NODE_10469_length_533_cov_83.271889_1_plen_94_part_01